MSAGSRHRLPHATGMVPIRIGMLVGSVGEIGGGVPASVRDLARALDRLPDFAVTVFASAGSQTGAIHDDWAPVTLNLFPIFGPSTFGFARGLDRALQQADIDVLHVHGLWMYISIAARRWAARTGKPYLVSPHGMLDSWALTNSGWKKSVALRVYERNHLEGASCVHALCEDERRAIRSFGLANPVCVIPNGVDLPAEGRSGAVAGKRRTLLFLGRVTPKKGLTALIEAWAATRGCSGAMAWDLEIVGTGAPDFIAGLEAQIRRHDLSASVRLVGHLAGQDKANAFRAADAFILPSVSEGQPLAVLEAWAYGLPTLITPQCNLPEGAAAGAAITIGSAANVMAEGLADLFAMPDAERLDMGERSRRLADTEFSWRNAADHWSQVYRRLSGGPFEPASMLGR